MTTESHFLAALDAAATDESIFATYGVYADWLGEMAEVDPGYAVRAKGYRWMWENQKTPREGHITGEAQWTVWETWSRIAKNPKDIMKHHIISDSKTMMKICYISGNGSFPSHRDAELALCDALHVVELEEELERVRLELVDMENRLVINCCKCDGGGTICGACRDARDVIGLRQKHWNMMHEVAQIKTPTA